MEEARDRQLNIVGERYRSFLEFYRVNERRPFNAQYLHEGDGATAGLFEIADGVVFSADDTKQALLYGSDIFDEQFDAAKLDARRMLRDKYEWLVDERFASDTHGQHVIVERHMLGHPEAFSRRRENRTKKRSVRIFYDAACPASTPVATRVQAGCSVLAAIDALETVGYETALSFVLAKYDGPAQTTTPSLLLDISLKTYGEPLNARRVQFPLASKSMLFHVGSWWTRRFARTPCHYGEGEGYPLSYDKARLAGMQDYARKYHGVYLSEDIIEMRLESSPVRVLEHVLGEMGELDELIAHMRAVTPLAAAVQPAQGKLFSGWEAGLDGLEAASALDPRGADGDAREPEAANGHTGGEGTDADAADSSACDGVEDGTDDSAGDELGSERPHDNGAPHEGEATQDITQGTMAGSRQASPERSQDAADAHASNAGDDSYAGSDTSGMPGGPEGDMRGDGDSSAGEPGPGGEQGDGEDAKGDGGTQRVGDGESQDSSGAADDDTDDDGSGDDTESEVGAMPQTDEEGKGIDFAQISKDLEEELQEAQAEDPRSVESFIVMLRKRYVLFEQGEYLRMMIDEKMRRRSAAKAELADAGGAVPPPPAAASAPTIDAVRFGPPRNTPFSMTYIPEKKK